MKRTHRRVHALAWLLLLPLLLAVVYVADRERLPPLPAQTVVSPSEAGVLP